MLRFLILLLAGSLFFTSCASTRVIRTLKEAKGGYLRGAYNRVDALIDATSQLNRDIQAASIVSLTAYLDELLDYDFKKGKIPRETIEDTIKQITRQFRNVYALSTDFNIKNLCLEGLARIDTQETADFLTTALSESEETSVELALKNLRPFLLDKRFKTEGSLAPTLAVFSKADMPVFQAAVSNLLLYPPNELTFKAMKNYQSLTQDPLRKAILEPCLAGYPVAAAKPVVPTPPAPSAKSNR